MVSKNIYKDRLEAFEYQEMLDSLAGIGTETDRLEVKRELIANHKIAHIACSMANANGGIVAIGIQEPDGNGALRVHSKINTSDAMKVGMLASINARVYPPLPLEIHGYENENRSAAFLVIRVDRSEMAPHEYTGTDDTNNLPVRRGSATDHLRLAEIDALKMRTSTSFTESPLGQKQFPQVSLQHEGMNPDCIFGMVVKPVFYCSSRRIMDEDDDLLCSKIVDETKGSDGNLHRDMERDALVDGVLLRTAKKTQQDAFQGRIPQPDQQIAIDSDGTITVRFLQTDSALFDQLFAVLTTGYVAAQEIFYAFGLSPAARVYIVQRLSASAQEAKIAQNYEDSFVIDLAVESFADAFLATTMRMLRAANQNSKRDGVRNEMLQAFVDATIPIADELGRRWLT